MSLLRESFAGISGRFHLAGLYAVSQLMLRLIYSSALTRPEIAMLGLFAMILIHAVGCGIRGMVFHAAAGLPPVPGLAPRYAMALFLPLFWLETKVGFLVLAGAGGMMGIHRLFYGEASTQQALETVLFWGEPLLELGAALLLLYSVPVCIAARAAGRWRPHLRAGLSYFRIGGPQTRRLIAPLAGLALLQVGLLTLIGREAANGEPGIPMALALLVRSYLMLVVLYGASRIVVAHERALAAVPRDGSSQPPHDEQPS